MSSNASRKMILQLLKRHSISSMATGASSQTVRQFHLLSTRPGVLSNSKDSLSNFVSFREMSDKTDGDEKKSGEEENSEDTTATEEEVYAEESTTEESEVEKLKTEIKDVKDQLLRSYAEQENIRRIAKKDIDNAKAFAITSFAKSLLDTSDNLTRALDAVPEEYRDDKENHAVLATLFEGIKMTDDGLTKAFAKNGLKKFGEIGEKFDPNMHEALFEYQDEKMETGSIGQVMKVGFSLKDRVIRPAEVGVIKSP